MTIVRMLTASVARDPDALAVVDVSERQSYWEWQESIRKLAGGLAFLGLRNGDHLVAFLSNRWETASLYWACQTIGAIFTPFNW